MKAEKNGVVGFQNSSMLASDYDPTFFGKYSAIFSSLIPIRILYTDPDPGSLTLSGSRQSHIIRIQAVSHNPDPSSLT